MILLQQRYDSPDPARQGELCAARAANASCPAFTELVDVDGAAKRWTFADLLQMAADRFRGKACVIANSDISFTASIADAGRLLQPNTLVALTRWDDDAAPSMEGRVDSSTWRFYSQSQDAWIFIAGGLPPFAADFRLGIPRCENRFAYEAAAAGVVVVNPALSLRTRHHHGTNLRTWKRAEHYRGPLFFPRLTTLDVPAPEGIVVDRRWGRHERLIRLDGSAASFQMQLTAAGPASLRRLPRVGLRSPFYIRRRG